MKMQKVSKGFTLIEMLIAVVVISVGILGVAAMQTLGVRYTQNSYMLSIATQQAQDMAERIRSNHAEMVDVTSGYYNNINGHFTGTLPDCITDVCTSEERAQLDHSIWTTTNSTLFGNTGSVSRVDERFLITVSWNDVESSGAVGRNYTLTFLP